MVRTRMCLIVLMLPVLFAGCDSTSRERLDLLEGVVAKASETSTAMTVELTTLRQGMVEMQAVLADPKVKNFVQDKKVKDVIIVPKRLANVVF